MSQGKIVKLASGATLEVLEDGTKIQSNTDGTVLTLLPNGVKRQTTKDGIVIEVRPDGSRTQLMTNGVILEIFPDGSSKQKNPDGTIVETFADKKRIQTHADGTVIEVFPDGTRIQTFADGKKVEIDKEGNMNALNFELDEEKTEMTKNPSLPDISKVNSIKLEPPAEEPKGTGVLEASIRQSETEENERRRDSFRGIGRVPVKRKSSLLPSEESLNQEISRLRAKLVEHQENYADAVSEKDDKIEALENYIIELNNEKVHEIRKKEVAIAELNEMIERDQAEKRTLRKSVESMKSSENNGIELLKKKIQNLEEANASLRSFNLEDDNSTHEQITKLKEELLEANSQKNELIGEIDHLKMSNAETQDKVVKLEVLLSETKPQIEQLQNEKNELESRIDELIYKGGSVAEQVCTLHDENSELKTTRQSLIQEVDKLNSDLVQSMSRSSDLELRVSNLLTTSLNAGVLQKRDFYLSRYKEVDSTRIIATEQDGLNAETKKEESFGSNKTDSTEQFTLVATKKSGKMTGKIKNFIKGKRNHKGSEEILMERIKVLETRINELEINISQKDMMIKEQIEFNKELQSQISRKKSIHEINNIAESTEKSSEETEGSEDIVKNSEPHVAADVAAAQPPSIDEREYFVKELQKQNEKLCSEIDELKSQLDAVPDISLFDEQVKAKDEKIWTLRADLAAVQEREAAAETKITDLQGLVETLKSNKIESATPEKRKSRSESAGEDSLLKYKRMLKAGLPEGAVKQAMSRDGINESLVFGEEKDKPDTTVSQHNTTSTEDSILLKYKKMLKAGLPEGAVRQSMQRDGVNPNELFEPSKGTITTVEVEDPKLLKYKKMLKAGLPEGAVRHSMQRDGVDVDKLFGTPADIPATPEKSEEIPSELQKYVRMKKAGLPEGAILNAMTRDGLDLALFSVMSGEKQAPASPVKAVIASTSPAPSGFLADIKAGKTLKKIIPGEIEEKLNVQEGPSSMFDELKMKGKSTLRRATDRSPPKKEAPAGGISMMDEIKQKGRNNLKRATDRKMPPKEMDKDNRNTIAELCRLKAQQRANRTEKINGMLESRHRSKSGTESANSELAAALSRRAKKMEE